MPLSRSLTIELKDGAGYRIRGLAIGAILSVTMIAFAGLSTAQAQGPGPRGPGAGPCCDFWQPGWMHRDMWRGRRGSSPDMEARMRRHRTYMHDGVPKAYEGAVSTVQPTGETIATGRRLYDQHCASCHGAKGLGDGEAAKGLTPSPALLAYMIERPIAVDEFLLWSISDGGVAFSTAMPAFKDVLSKDEIWQIIAFMRAGFPR